MKFEDIFSPVIAWKNLFKQPVTIKKPLTERPGADRYRGFHKNDIDKCIGCGSCEEICQNGAIDLVPVEGVETIDGDSGLRPRIDYGRCCWCALCVDICTTNSLDMSNEYTWVETDPDLFRFIPGAEDKKWDKAEKGYKKPENYTLNPLKRVDMKELKPEKRDNSFIEIVQGYSKKQAMEEADRCVECGLCIATCPAHMGIPAYIKAIREDNIEEGLKVLYDTNPLPEICGRICTHKCETVCAIQHKGDPLSIRWLKRYIADQVDSKDYKKILESEKIDKNGKKVAIVGAGPAGLSNAYYLTLMGYQVTIFEALEKPGGMMRYGIPEYRLPYDQIDKDVNYILSLGVELKTGIKVGKDVTLDKLHNDFDAVFVATGLHLGRSTRIDGTDHEDVFQAIDLLREFTEGKEIKVPKKVVVIGGGNVAMDISRTMARLQKVKYGKVGVITTCLETEDIMPADREEIVESREENVVIKDGWGPKDIVIKDGKIKGLNVIKCLSVFNEEGRFSPQFNPSEKQFFEADIVVESIGQGSDISYITDEIKKGLKFDNRGRVVVDSYFQSDVDWLFAGGDIIEGPDVIHGVANGHKAAIGIDKFLNKKGKKVKKEGKK